MNTARLLCAAFLLFAGAACSIHAETIQIDLRALLNARIVTTLTDGQLVAWSDSLDGSTSGEATLAAATKIGEPFSRALPDDGIFPATAHHPRIELHFSNAAGTGNQVHRSLAADEYTIPVPVHAYRQFWIVAMSGFGESTLRVRLAYTDGSAEVRDLVIPDWYFPISAGDPRRGNLAEDLGKWNQANHLMEKDHHFLHGFDLAPDPKRVLSAISITKLPKAVLTLWGAVGVTS
jgi:hypothetical protein